MPSVCKNCGCSEIDADASRGDAVCTNCGSVIDNQIIVAEVEFEENSAGGANVIGQFISAEGGRSFTFGGTFKNGLGQDSRQATLSNGKFLINNCGNQLKFSSHCLDTAFMFYKLAVSKRLTQGRRLPHVIGACLYLVSRTEKTPHLLIDISDACQVDMRLLGKTYLLLSKELCIDIPLIDPCLYIHRFAHQLGFKEKENEIAMTAVRIVARMKRDWLQYGRRPSGLCGAALVIAARLHGFRMQVNRVVKVVRVAQTTLVKRLHDFARTPTSRLTIDEFQKVDLEEEMDPPCFTAGRNRLKHAQIFEESMNLGSVELLAQVALTQNAVERLIEKRKRIEEQLIEDEQNAMEEKVAIAKKVQPILPENAPPMIAPESSQSTDTQVGSSATEIAEQATAVSGDLKSLVAWGSDKVEEAESTSDENKVMEDLDLEGLDDDELDELLLNENEVEMKTKVWMEENEEFLAMRKEKEEQAAREMEENKDKPKKKKYTKRKLGKIDAATADEAIKTMLSEKRLSSKINYDVLRGLKSELFDGDNASPSTSSTDAMETVIEDGPVAKQPKRHLKSALKTPSLFGSKAELSTDKPSISFAVKNESKNDVDIDTDNPAGEVAQPIAAKTEQAIPAPTDIVVESGPVLLDNNADDPEEDGQDDDMDDDNDGEVTASALFGQEEDDFNYDMYEEEDDTTFY